MSENRAVTIALGLGTLAGLVGASLLLTPGKALAQGGCPGTGGPLCQEQKKCTQWKDDACFQWTYNYVYWSKAKT